ncbi:V-type ATP synthase subunit D [Acidilobus saccharovorans 345-15]|uniref:A-type ATP synthase subunit D n=1 Tax=Acidilobus saccharovorans (strain DSM 16705 / JCM 18335 / VKM B-2471 / 345-15) TaxID=666510 RepID=D9Q0Q2_ACIS3|nr:V-type ATP synthase subunit D [Acidilobus saccharovorans]ADL18890.1 V-type ATP synthase subunit D [Acidilobus saccharovorans 345-15]
MAIDVRSTLPTKINLIRLRREYATIRRIRRVLEEKRDVLLHYIRSVAEDYNRYQKEVYSRLEEMFTEFYRGEASEGIQRTWAYADSVKSSLRIKAGVTVMFTVRAPVFQLIPTSVATPAIPPGSSPDLVESYVMLREEVPAILRLAQYEETITRLIEELKRTQRLINSLDYVIIPSYERAIKFISMVLDEREREDFVRLKHLKRMLTAAEESRAARAPTPQQL